MPRFIRFLSAVILMAFPAFALAQNAQVAFGDSKLDSSLPVEVTADNLTVNQEDNSATFTGNVLIGQGEMRLTAPQVLVIYRADRSGIEIRKASGGVTLVSGEDAAEAAQADYNVDNGLIEMQGNVLLVQGFNTITSDKMFVDTNAGTARMAGRVKTVLNPKPAE